MARHTRRDASHAISQECKEIHFIFALLTKAAQTLRKAQQSRLLQPFRSHLGVEQSSLPALPPMLRHSHQERTPNSDQLWLSACPIQYISIRDYTTLTSISLLDPISFLNLLFYMVVNSSTSFIQRVYGNNALIKLLVRICEWSCIASVVWWPTKI